MLPLKGIPNTNISVEGLICCVVFFCCCFAACSNSGSQEPTGSQLECINNGTIMRMMDLAVACMNTNISDVSMYIEIELAFGTYHCEQVVVRGGGPTGPVSSGVESLCYCIVLCLFTAECCLQK